MAENLRELTEKHARNGCVRWIGLRPARRADVNVVACAELTLDGLAGDRARAGKRALSLFQEEHLAVIAAFLGRDTPVAPELLRRNLGVGGLNLLSLRGSTLAIGSEALVRITGPCAPCSRMQEAFGHGGYAAVRGHGGMVAEVLHPGPIAVGDPVIPLPG